MIQFIKVIDSVPEGSPQSFKGNMPPSADWKYYRATTENYNTDESVTVDKYIPEADIVAQLIIPFPQELTEAICVYNLRIMRNQKLSECDWTQLNDNNLTDSEKASWAVYRNELRDITKTYSDVNSVIWPSKPE